MILAKSQRQRFTNFRQVSVSPPQVFMATDSVVCLVSPGGKPNQRTGISVSKKQSVTAGVGVVGEGKTHSLSKKLLLSTGDNPASP